LYVKPHDFMVASALGQQRIRAPKIEVRRRGRDVVYREREDLGEHKRLVTSEPLVLRSNLAGPIPELSRRIREHRSELPVADERQQVSARRAH
jgi:hypothetical protein